MAKKKKAEKSPEERIESGHKAQGILDNPVFHDAVEELKDGYHSDWERSHPDDTQKREQTFHKIQVLEDVVGKLNSIASDRKLAKRQ